MSPFGGIQDGDVIPAGGTSTERLMAPQISIFPWLLFDGTLTDGVDALVISPSIWEEDGDNTPFLNWVQSQTGLNVSLGVDPLVVDQITQRRFVAIQNGSASPVGGFTINPSAVIGIAVANGALGLLGLPPLAFLLAGSTDRPIGMVSTGIGTSALPNTTVVLTREIIEAALSQPALGVTMVNGMGLFLPKPGLMVIPFVDGQFGGAFTRDRPAVYLMIIQVERLP